jgi:hypothetical protein
MTKPRMNKKKPRHSAKKPFGTGPQKVNVYVGRWQHWTIQTSIWTGELWSYLHQREAMLSEADEGFGCMIKPLMSHYGCNSPLCLNPLTSPNRWAVLVTRLSTASSERFLWGRRCCLFSKINAFVQGWYPPLHAWVTAYSITSWNYVNWENAPAFSWLSGPHQLDNCDSQDSPFSFLFMLIDKGNVKPFWDEENSPSQG